MLAALALRNRYRSDYDSLLRDFYLPCFSEANRYDRGVGFFTASSLSLAIDGIHGFIANDGTMRLVVSPHLTEEDIRAISEGYESREHIIERALIRTLVDSLSDSFHTHLCFVSWLIEHSILDIKVAVTTSGRQMSAYHEKLGIFTDATGNVVAFTGSANETINGIVGNFERIDVFRSWNAGDADRLPGFRSDFQELWANTTPGLKVIDFPQAVREELMRVAPPTYADVTSRPMDRPKSSPTFELTKVELRPRQIEAVEKWLTAKGRGILEMATGSGKTITALACAASIPELGAVMIAVPSLELVQQWNTAIRAFTDLPPPIEAVGDSKAWMEKFFRKLNLARANDSYLKSSVPCIVGTYSSLSDDKVSRLITDAGGLPLNSLLICDEVHNAGAPTYQNTLRADFSLRLGLSATPVRKYDEEGNEAVVSYFGDTVYSFDIGMAIAAGVLAEYDYNVLPIYLSEQEYKEYQDLSRRIATTAATSSLTEEVVKLLLIRRSNILKSASGKAAALQNILEQITLTKALVYAANIEEATSFTGMLTHAGLRSARYSSVDADRRKILNDFARGRLDVLVSINCLDEGVDVPGAQIAVLASSDGSERQFIQRRGRVLRTAPDKTHAIIFDFIVLPPHPDQPIRIFEAEIRRVAEFAQHARNRDSIAARITDLLLPYGFSVSQVMMELGR